MKGRKGILLCVLMLSMLTLLCAIQSFGADISGAVTSGPKLMKAFFGNYLTGPAVSYLETGSITDPQLLTWEIGTRNQIINQDGFDVLSQQSQSEFLSLVGKIPIKYLGHWLLSDTQLLLIFEAGGWSLGVGTWGGSGYEVSHNMGAAAYSLQDGIWHCTGFSLDLGKFGAYCHTTLNPNPIFLGSGLTAIQTLDHGSALISVIDGYPKVILRNPCWQGFGHGDPETYESVLTTVPMGNLFYDVFITSSGTAIIYSKNSASGTQTTQKNLQHLRTYKWDNENQEYKRISSEGNIENIIRGGDDWFPSWDSEF